jgi:hypothetical protein
MGSPLQRPSASGALLPSFTLSPQALLAPDTRVQGGSPSSDPVPKTVMSNPAVIQFRTLEAAAASAGTSDSQGACQRRVGFVSAQSCCPP